MGLSISGILNKLPNLGSLSKIANSSVGKTAINILKQLASSAFQSIKQNGLYGDIKLGINIPNPLKALQKFLAPIGKTFSSIGDFMKKIGGLLSGERNIDGQKVTVPSLADRAKGTSQAASGAAASVAAGNHDAAIRAATTSGKGPWTDILNNKNMYSTGLTSQQQKVLESIEDPQEKARMSAQFQLQNHVEMMAMISNIMKMQHEAAMSVINNMR